MASTFGGTVKLSGESEYQKAIKQITSNLKLMSSELKLATTQFMNDERAVNETKQSYSNINSKVKEQREHVKSLKETLSKLTDEYGENNEEVQKFKTQLNKAEAELSDMEKKTNASNDELKDMKTNFDNAGNSGLKFGDIIKANVISSAVINGVKNLGSAVASVGRELIDIGKQALNSYAEYEQLEGGVQSMFGGIEKGEEQINKVLDLSKSAWKDLTMSENDYIKTFSSTYPLMKNDIEDQNEAIEKTNRIMTLNSDLANTFGYSMETASTAVNWALKGTYSYLDNLNIGIKGTKEGFLEAAKSVGYTVKSVDELSSSDILDILEKCADKYGVLGKTAEEANKTISGSVNSMKSAWSNLLTGIADDNADFETLINNFVDSVVTAGNNILPRVQQVVQGLGKMVSGLLKTIVPEIVKIIPPLIKETIPMLVQAISDTLQSIYSLLPEVVDVISELVPQIVQTILDLIPQLLDVGMQIIGQLIEGITKAIPKLLGMLPSVMKKIGDTFIKNLPMLLDVSLKLILTLVEGLAEYLPKMQEYAPTMIETVVNTLMEHLPELIDVSMGIIMTLVEAMIENLPTIVAFTPRIIFTIYKTLIQNLPKIFESGKIIIQKLIEGIGNMIGNLGKKAEEIKNTVVRKIQELPGKALSVGTNLVHGIWDGISGSLEWIKGKINEWCGNVVDFCKKVLGINSPSKVMADQVGKFMALGIGEGFAGEMSSVTKDMQNAIPTEFDVSSSVVSGSSSNSFNNLKDAVKDVLKDFKPAIILNGKEIGEYSMNYINNKGGLVY